MNQKDVMLHAALAHKGKKHSTGVIFWFGGWWKYAAASVVLAAAVFAVVRGVRYAATHVDLAHVRGVAIVGLAVAAVVLGLVVVTRGGGGGGGRGRRL